MKSLIQILNSPIVLESGEEVATIDDVIIDEGSGEIRYVSVKPKNKKNNMRVRLKWSEIEVGLDADKYRLNSDKSIVNQILLSKQ